MRKSKCQTAGPKTAAADGARTTKYQKKLEETNKKSDLTQIHNKMQKEIKRSKSKYENKVKETNTNLP